MKKFNKRIGDWVYNDSRYKRSRKKALVRDCGVCQQCKVRPGTECHHKIELDNINSNRYSPDLNICFGLDNLIMLCPDCHNKQRINNCANDVIFDEHGNIMKKV